LSQTRLVEHIFKLIGKSLNLCGQYRKSHPVPVAWRADHC
jgi:hypothetical protein